MYLGVIQSKENYTIMNYNMSIEDYKKMISTQEFAMKQYAFVDYFEFEQLTSFGNIANLFEELAVKMDRVPTQDEYVTEGVVRAKAYFCDPAKMKDGGRWLPIKKDAKGKVTKWHHFKWTVLLNNAITQRLARSYPSHMVEYSTILALKNKSQYMVGANDYLDTLLAVDVVVGSKEHNKIAYVHVTSDSAYSDKWLKIKEDRKGVKYANGKRFEYARNFKKGHVHLAFTKTFSDSTDVINGIPMLKESYIQSKLEVAFLQAPSMDTLKGKEQLVQLHTWLKGNGIDANGLGSVWL